MQSVAIHGLEPRQGETAFAFLVLRLARPMARDEIIEVLRGVAPVLPESEAFIAGFPDDIDESMQLLGLPWLPPEAGELEVQRGAIERATSLGLEAAWFFQIGTSLPSEEEDEADGDDEEDDDEEEGEDEDAEEEGEDGAGAAKGAPEPLASQLATSADDNWDDLFVGDVTDPQTQRLHLDDVQKTDDEDEDDDDDESDEDDDDESDDEDDASDDEDEDEEGEDDEVDDESDDDDDDSDDEDEDEDEDDEDSDDDDEEEEPEWSHGPPPLRTEMPFPVDGFPAIVDEYDWEDFGISFKLAGPLTPGVHTVLLGFHALWLSPYGPMRYRNASVTLDRTRHAAHLWVDRFTAPGAPEEQVGYLLWVLSKLHEVTPVLHARFGGATMAEKYGGMMGDTREPFVLGGNPLVGIYARGGEEAVDEWISEQTEWTNEEVAQMLRELAELIVSSSEDDDEDDDDDEDEDDDEADLAADDADDDDDESSDDADADESSDADDVADDESDEDEDGEDEDGEDDDEDGEDEDEDDEDRGRYITAHAAELLLARARTGALDPRAAAALRSLLEAAGKDANRRAAAASILGALRDPESVPALIRILEDNPIQGALDSIHKEDLLAETASALGAIGDPAAIPALAKLVAARGPHNDRPRPAAAGALAACLAAAPGAAELDDAAVGAMLETIRDRNDGELNAEMHVAYGRLARQLPPARRDDIRRRLAETPPARDDNTAALARQSALALASGTGPVDAGTAASLRPLLHGVLTELDYDHEHTVRNIRIGLGVAALLPELVAPADLIWLTRFPEAEVRARAHALLERLHHGMPPARSFDPGNVSELSDGELLLLVGEPHVVGRAALVDEVARRDLSAGRRNVRDAVQDVMNRAPLGGNLLAHDSRLLEVAVPWLRTQLDDDTASLFDRMLRHPNPHVKWVLLEELPDDERLLGGMFHVLGERWGWQEEAAREWLRSYEGGSAFESARARLGLASLDLTEDDDDDEDDESDEDDEGADAGDDGEDSDDDEIN